MNRDTSSLAVTPEMLVERIWLACLLLGVVMCGAGRVAASKLLSQRKW